MAVLVWIVRGLKLEPLHLIHKKSKGAKIVKFFIFNLDFSCPLITLNLKLTCSSTINFFTSSCYRPQRSCGKAMFLHLSVSHSVHRGGVSASVHAGIHPLAGTPPKAGKPSPGRYTPHDGHCSGRYASYWNAFLFFGISVRSYLLL